MASVREVAFGSINIPPPRFQSARPLSRVVIEGVSQAAASRFTMPITSDFDGTAITQELCKCDHRSRPKIGPRKWTLSFDATLAAVTRSRSANEDLTIGPAMFNCHSESRDARANARIRV